MQQMDETPFYPLARFSRVSRIFPHSVWREPGILPLGNYPIEKSEFSMKMQSQFHHQNVHVRRCRVLVNVLENLLPRNARVLDIGCGDGRIASLLSEYRPDLHLTGVDIHLRVATATMAEVGRRRPDGAASTDPTATLPRISVCAFDGVHLPFQEGSFDWAIFLDVLHHARHAKDLLKEAIRVVRQGLMVKDHELSRPFAGLTLQFMDWFSNVDKGFALDCHYRSRGQWSSLWQELSLKAVFTERNLGLYPFPFSLVFERGLHFLSLLKKSEMFSGRSLRS